jgi:hypothetical protein
MPIQTKEDAQDKVSNKVDRNWNRKKKEVPFSILDKLVLMVKHCEEGNFLAANDQYIRTAIGNAAWPIGELVQYIVVGAVVCSCRSW